MKKVTGTELVDSSELVNNVEMARRGFKNIEIASRGNITGYFMKEGSDYVYVETYSAALKKCARLIVDKGIFDMLDLEHRTVVLNSGKGDGTRAVPSVSVDKTIKALHGCVYEGAQIDHSFMSLNIITKDSLRECTTADNAKNKKNLHKCKKLSRGGFGVEIKEKYGFLSEVDLDTLRNEGYTISNCSNGVVIRKRFETEREALKAIREHENRFYGDYAYSPLKDMRGHFEAVYRYLILGEISEEDVIREILESISTNAVLIARYNLEDEYEKRGMPYNHGSVLQDGSFVAA